MEMKLKNLLSMSVFYLLMVCIFISAAYLGSEVTSTLAERIPLEREHIILIDPGHGGEDGGATSISGKLESAYNLEISLGLRDLLHLLGFKTKMIRTQDESVYTQGQTIAEKKVSDLKNRVNMVNNEENPILISIHQNTFSDSRYHGAQVFYGPKGESKTLAEALQRAFCQTVNPGSNRAIKKADGIYLMQHIDCTGVLIECGFLSNPQEDALLQTKTYQQKLNCVIAGTISQFLTDS